MIDSVYRLTILNANVLNVTEHTESVNINDTEKVIVIHSNISLNELEAKGIDPSLQNINVQMNFHLPANYVTAVYNVKEGIEFVNNQLEENVSS